ncbi:MAG: hypothetical protein LBB53_06095 [Prevotellaceae bacterium]|jgi:hypothetical protein|nr:hypothetical protein [Prevotellaceae bacterium]
MEKSHKHSSGHSHVSMSGWLGILFLLTIPLVNIYFLINWAFIQKISRTKRNFSRAFLTWCFIVILLLVLFLIIFRIDLAETLSKFINSITTMPVVEEIIVPDESYLQ